MAIRYEKLFRKHNLPYRTFDNTKDAESWVADMLQA